MTAPAVPVTDADVRAEITRLTARITELRALIDAEIERGHAIRTSESFADSVAVGHVTGLEP